MMKKVLVVCGPTATGKTELALDLALKLKGELVSVDSRQVYKGMDIGTGKDLPTDARLCSASKDRFLEGRNLPDFYQLSKIRLWGYDLVSPTESFSVASYLRKIIPVVRNIQRRKKLPILVGGSGLYLQALIDGLPTVFVPRDDKLRKYLADFSAEDLFERLAQIDSKKAASLNQSDRKNPRRLTRAIEVAQWRLINAGKKIPSLSLGRKEEVNYLIIGLTAPLDFLKKRIKKRVLTRNKTGFKEEISCLLESGLSWQDQSLQTLGYKHFRGYFENKLGEREVLENWARDEFLYAKKQLEWFKRDKRIRWFDISDPNYKEKVEKLVMNWYNKP